jgi:hypothetical protein
MPELVWYRSLYWRIALGFVALLAAAPRGAGDGVSLADRAHVGASAGRSPAEYSQTIAADLVTTLAEKPDVDLDGYLNDKYPRHLPSICGRHARQPCGRQPAHSAAAEPGARRLRPLERSQWPGPGRWTQRRGVRWPTRGVRWRSRRRCCCWCGEWCCRNVVCAASGSQQQRGAGCEECGRGAGSRRRRRRSRPGRPRFDRFGRGGRPGGFGAGGPGGSGGDGRGGDSRGPTELRVCAGRDQ